MRAVQAALCLGGQGWSTPLTTPRPRPFFSTCHSPQPGALPGPGPPAQPSCLPREVPPPCRPAPLNDQPATSPGCSGQGAPVPGRAPGAGVFSSGPGLTCWLSGPWGEGAGPVSAVSSSLSRAAPSPREDEGPACRAGCLGSAPALAPAPDPRPPAPDPLLRPQASGFCLQPLLLESAFCVLLARPAPRAPAWGGTGLPVHLGPLALAGHGWGFCGLFSPGPWLLGLESCLGCCPPTRPPLRELSPVLGPGMLDGLSALTQQPSRAHPPLPSPGLGPPPPRLHPPTQLCMFH